VATSTVQAGYISVPTDGVSSVSATLKVPTIDCSDGNLHEDDWGIDVDDVLEADVATTCTANGTASYDFVIGATGTLVAEPGVGPGDTVQLSVSQTTTTQRSEVHDFTSNFTWAIDGPPTGPLSSLSSACLTEAIPRRSPLPISHRFS
jgi:hypothetical protein